MLWRIFTAIPTGTEWQCTDSDACAEDSRKITEVDACPPKTCAACLDASTDTYPLKWCDKGQSVLARALAINVRSVLPVTGLLLAFSGAKSICTLAARCDAEAIEIEDASEYAALDHHHYYSTFVYPHLDVLRLLALHVFLPGRRL